MKKIIFICIILFFSCQKDSKDEYVVEFDSNQYNSLVLNKQNGTYLLKRFDGSFFNVEGSIITFIHNSKKEIDTISKGGEVIASLVVDYNSDENFAIVLQKPMTEICQMYSVAKYTPGECDDLMEKSKKFNYWIIVKSSNFVHGPLQLEEYKKLKNQLRISKDLKLINE